MFSWRALWRHPDFRDGARDMALLSPGMSAWALVTGVAMVKGGLPVPLALLMTFVVFAGSAQLAVVPLMVAGAPLWVIWATALCVNLRFVIFSAQWRPFLMRFTRSQRLGLTYLAGDLNYVLFMKRYREPQVGQGQVEYYLGTALTNWVIWQVPCVFGIFAAHAIPPHWGLGFAGVLALMGLACALVTDRRTAVAAAVAGGAAITSFALPLKLNIVVAICAAVCVGLLIDAAGGGRGRALSAGEDGGHQGGRGVAP